VADKIIRYVTTYRKKDGTERVYTAHSAYELDTFWELQCKYGGNIVAMQQVPEEIHKLSLVIDLQIQLWKAMRELEQEVGHDLDNLSIVEDATVGFDEGFGCVHFDKAVELLNMVLEENGLPPRNYGHLKRTRDETA